MKFASFLQRKSKFTVLILTIGCSPLDFAILRLLNCDDPISYFRDDAHGLLVSYGFFYLLATFVIIAFPLPPNCSGSPWR